MNIKSRLEKLENTIKPEFKVIVGHTKAQVDQQLVEYLSDNPNGLPLPMVVYH